MRARVEQLVVGRAPEVNWYYIAEESVIGRSAKQSTSKVGTGQRSS
jgi:hypothetical protein